MFNSLDPHYHPFDPSSSFAEYMRQQQQTQPTPPSSIVNSIEFTDLTQIHSEDSPRRRRRSTTARDKEAATNMRIVSPRCLACDGSTSNHYSPISVGEHRIGPPSAHSVNVRKSTCSTLSTSWSNWRRSTRPWKRTTPRWRAPTRNFSGSATS